MRVGAILLVFLLAVPARAADAINVAVASNFSRAAAELAEQFEAETGLAVRLSIGSTGKLYAQILNGAPFDVFLAADTARPARLERSGHAVAGTRFTYATGSLVLWSRSARDCLAALTNDGAGHVALANPETAPYGKAAVEFLATAGYWESVSARAVYGENINQALQFAATGNAAIGIVARSQLTAPQLPAATCTWVVPAASSTGLEQQAVLLQRAADNANALRFFEFLGTDRARATIRRHGYELAR